MSEFPKVRIYTCGISGQTSIEDERGEILFDIDLDFCNADMPASDLARRVAAALNATRDISLEDLESPDPLKELRETWCREQRDACADAAYNVLAENGEGQLGNEMEAAILATPAPEPEQQ